jgi:uncharacterized Ntn-hydrolase superfamily protein
VDPETEEFGVAVASRVPDVGYIVPWIIAGVGCVASQAYSNPYLGPWALEAMAHGKSAEQALNEVLAKDTLFEERQIGIVDKNGVSAAFTGKNTNEWAGHRTDKFVSVQGNILTGPEVIDTMLEVFQQTTGTLAERLMSALEAGEAAGGDKRGKQSAAIVILRKRGGYQGVDDRLVELKVVDNEEPVKELRRQYELWQYTFLASAYLRLGDEEKDKEEFFLKKTMLLLEKAMKSDLDKPEVYNSLAWEFAIRKKFPEQTLAAAKKAHELAPDDANIMDTYAEAYYASGDCKNAVKWEKEALKIEPDNEFFKKQLKKFQQAQKSHR